MLAEGKEHARRVIADARQVRYSVAASAQMGPSRQEVSPALIKSFDQLLELAETLLSEQDLYESRLHRSRHAEPAIMLPSSHPQ